MPDCPATTAATSYVDALVANVLIGRYISNGGRDFVVKYYAYVYCRYNSS